MAIRIDLEQRSEGWHSYRSTRIGGSDAAIVMGISPYCTPLKLWERKKCLAPEQPMNNAMQKGIDQEDEALEWLSMTTGHTYKPAVFSYKANDRLMASLDGINEAGDIIVEIKCSQKIFDAAKKGEIFPYYMAQIQHQMMITETSKCLFVAFDGFDGVIIEVERDQEFIDRMLVMELEFLDFLDKDIAPPSSEEEHIKVQLDDDSLIEDWISVKNQIDHLEGIEKNLRKLIEEEGDSGNVEFISRDGEPLLKITRIKRSGSIDWAGLCAFHNIPKENIEKFRKPQIGFYKFKIQ